MKIIVSYSGGKDSQACLIWATKTYALKNIEAVFCDTGWENPVTYDHIKNTCSDLGVKLTTIKSTKYNGMVDLAMKKGRFPSVKARFCTEELKAKPMIDWVLQQEDNLTIIQGIRSQESHSRSQMSKQCRYFKYYFEPFSHDKKGRPKLHSYRKKEVKDWVSKYSDDILRPVFDWSGQEVIQYILDNGQQPNPLYFEGFKRVGCFPCIMSGHNEVAAILERYPGRFDLIEGLERQTGSSFFKIDFVPERYKTGTCNRTGKPFTTAADVRTYLSDKGATGDLFADEKFSCSSYYHLCE